MVNLSVEEKAKRYDEAIERVKVFKEHLLEINEKDYADEMDYIFPELKESEDERIRKELLNAFQESEESLYMVLTPHRRASFIAWLEKQGEHARFREAIQVGDQVTKNEDGVLVNLSQLNRVAKKQGEQKSADNIEQKFKVGDWVVDKLGNILYVKGVYDTFSKVIDEQGRIYNYDNQPMNENCHLWTIQDAKDGDVLATKDSVFIFKHIDKTGLSLCKSYCEVIGNSKLGLGFDFSINGVYPATKEQRDQLEKAMADAGYKCDTEKKEVKKIEQKSTEWYEKIKGLDELETYILSLAPDIPLDAVKVDSKNIRFLINKEHKPAWSEEIEAAISLLKHIAEEQEKDYCPYNANDLRKAAQYLESIKPQSQWKPSEEQMADLWNMVCECRPADQQLLQDLYFGLKTLRGE